MDSIDDSMPTYDELAAHLATAASACPVHEKLFRDAAAALLTEHNKIIAQEDSECINKGVSRMRERFNASQATILARTVK